MTCLADPLGYTDIHSQTLKPPHWQRPSIINGQGWYGPGSTPRWKPLNLSSLKSLALMQTSMGLGHRSRRGHKRRQVLQTKSLRWLLPICSRIRLRPLMPDQTWSKSVKRWWSNGQSILHADARPPGAEPIPGGRHFEYLTLNMTGNLSKAGNV